MSPYYPPGSEESCYKEDKPHFTSAEELSAHQAENLRAAIGDDLFYWLGRKAMEDSSERRKKIVKSG